MAAKGLLDVFVSAGEFSLNDASSIRKTARSKGVSIEEELVFRGIDEQKLLLAKAEVLGIPAVSLAGRKIPYEILKNIPEESVRHYQFVPFGVEDGSVQIGMVDPENIEAKEALKFIASRINQPFKLYLISRGDFTKALGGYKGISGEVSRVLGELETAIAEEPALPTATATTSLEAIVEEAPITKIVAVILRHAVEGKASDVHIEPEKDELRIRFRVDGVLHTSLLLPLKVHEAIAARVKILTNMLLDEKRKPQDGRFSARIEGRDVDFRVSTFPTYFGEKVVIRILDPTSGVKSLDDLELYDHNLKALRDGLARPYGLILLTGPTGSGKSTSLYAMLQYLNEEQWNIVSLEDPIEYSVPGVNQSQVRPEIGYDFAQGLRHILRQDPDIIMVGEIRDKETAQLAIHAALTGHVVLSTLHTNNAVGVIPRLIDMGVDPYLIAPTLSLAIGQRLVRTLCADSRDEIPVEGTVKEALTREIDGMPEEFRKHIKLPKAIYRGKPSANCPKGTRGRIAVFEVLSMTKELEKIVLENPAGSAIEAEAKRQGMITLRQDGILKVLDGKIGLEELMEVS